MDTSVITAASALAGAAIGGFTSLVAAWLSHRVQAKAERLAHDQLRRQDIIHIYLEPNKTFPELREMADSGLIDPLRNFSEACRAESETLHYEPPD